MRVMGDSYGWCDYCHTKMCFGEDDARDALTDIENIMEAK